MKMIKMMLLILWSLNITGLSNISWLALSLSTVLYYVVEFIIFAIKESVKDKNKYILN